MFFKAVITHLRVTKLPLEYPERVLTNRGEGWQSPGSDCASIIQWLAGLPFFPTQSSIKPFSSFGERLGVQG